MLLKCREILHVLIEEIIGVLVYRGRQKFRGYFLSKED